MSLRGPISYVLEGGEVSPSAADGVSGEEEEAGRAWCAVKVQEVGVVLGLPQVTVARAVVLMHRYLWTVSLRTVSQEGLVVAVLLLASKLDDREKNVSEIVEVLQAVSTQGFAEGTVTTFSLDTKLKKTAVVEERRLLRYLGFMTHVEDPYKYLVFYLHEVLQDDLSLLSKAWAYLTDSLRTDASVHFHPHEVATGCIYLALRKAGQEYPADDPSHPAWWELFDVTTDRMIKVVAKVEKAYTVNPASFEAKKTS